MESVHALVAENSAHFVHALEPADYQPFEVELCFYAQVHIYVQRIVVRFEGARRRAYFKRGQYGSIHLEIAEVIEIRAYFADYLRTLYECGANLGIYDEVEVALAVFEVDIGKTVLLFGQGAQSFGEHLYMRAVHRNFARLGLEHEALYAEDIAYVKVLFVGGVRLFADVVALYVNLNETVAVGDVRKGSLAHYAAGHEPARNGHFLAFERVEISFDIF